MKSAAALWGLAAVGLIMQGALATFVRPFWCPDLALVMVLCIGMQWEGFASGSLLAALLGFAADLLAGSLFGQHALLFLLVFAGGQMSARQLNLRSALSLVMAGFAATLLGGLLLVLESNVWLGGFDGGWFWRPGLFARAGVSALFTPAIFALVQALAARMADEEIGPRTQRLARVSRVP